MYNWDLSALYSSFNSEEFQNDLKKLEEKIVEVNNFKELFTKNENPEKTLEKYLEVYCIYKEIGRKLGSFASLNKSTDTSNGDAIKYMNYLSELMARATKTETIAARWIASLDLEKIGKENPKLAEFGFYLEETKNDAKHMLNEETEELLAKLSQSGGTAWSNLQGLLTSTLDVDHEGQEITLSEVRNLAYEKDKEIRKKAYESELKAYKKIEKSIAASLNAIKSEVNTMNDVRGFASPIEKTLKDSRMKKETLDALLSSMRDYLPEFRKYLKRKGEILGYREGLPFYELFAPIGNVEKNFTVEDAQKYILENFKTFSPRLEGVAKRAFNENWIDYHPKKGKVGGAFCANIPPIKESRILSNFTGSFSDVLTLAHELGHAYHGDCIFSENILNTSYTMPVAETASIMCETIVMKKAIKEASDNEKLFLLESSLQDITQVVVDILSRYIFEETVFNKRRDTVISVEDLKKIMTDAQMESYGDGLDKNYLHPYMWVCKGHYYRPSLSFYNFPYAFGALFGKGLYSQYLLEGEAFVEKYDNLLKLTGQKTVEEAAALAGIDVTDKKFWNSSLELVKKDIELFLSLTEKLV